MTMPVLFLPGSLCDERVFADQLREIDHPSAVADLTLDRLPVVIEGGIIGLGVVRADLQPNGYRLIRGGNQWI